MNFVFLEKTLPALHTDLFYNMRVKKQKTNLQYDKKKTKTEAVTLLKTDEDFKKEPLK